MSDDGDIELSDGDIDDRKHQQLLDNVLNLSKAQHVKRPSRTEPASEVSEFNLLKSVPEQRDAVDVNDLANVVRNNQKHLNITRVVKERKKKLKTLPAPLPSPQASLIRRTLNYDKSRVGLDRWEGVVMSNRAAPKLYFPLGSVERPKDVYKEAEKFPSRFRIKSDLQKAMEALEQTVEPPAPTEEEEDTKTYLLTLEELQEKRKEAAKLRAHQSFKEAKARQRKKIKSKSYHRMLKKERIKQKLKELEELQKTNPEEALKRLDDIEKIRAQERFSLRHKGTGQWAKNKQIRAKYDKETRQQLAEQLAISRDLTRKSKLALNDSDEEVNEEEDPLKTKAEEGNPWVNGIKPGQEVSEFLSGYRKFLENTHKVNEEGNKEVNEENSGEKKKVTAKKRVLGNKERLRKQGRSEMDSASKRNGNNSEQVKEKKKKLKTKTSKSNLDKSNKSKPKSLNSKDGQDKKPKLKTKKGNSNGTKKRQISFLNGKKKNEVNTSTSDWTVEKTGSDLTIDEIFETLEVKLNKKLNKKKNSVKRLEKKASTPKRKKTVPKTKKKPDLSMPLRSKKPIIDEEMMEEPARANENTTSNELTRLKNILKSKDNTQQTPNINPGNFLKVKTNPLDSAIPDVLTTDDNEENSDQRQLITEAFEDDDVVEEFQKEKAKAMEEDNPKDIQLSLPGWGSWVGPGINPEKSRKKKRLILKSAPAMPRKDANKGSLIINSKAESKVKPFLVSEVPFPFKSVEDYEASIRAPISNTFVPETAYRKLIEPTVKTKMGAIIEPIDKNIFIQKKN